MLENIISLTLSVPIQDEERKLSYIFIFTLPCGASKGFHERLTCLHKTFEAPKISGNKNLS